MKTQKFFHNKAIIAGAFLDFLLLDQLSKYLIRFHLEEPITVTSFFQIVFVENRGAAFSMAIPEMFIITLAIGVIAFLGYQFFTQKLPVLMQWSYVLIAAGAAGNLIDRILFGAVTDFLSFWSFPIFNIADTCITLGVCVFLWSEIQTKKQTP